MTGQHGTGGVLGVEEVGLAPQPAVPAIGAHHLHDTDVTAADRGGQSGAVGPGASIAKVSRCPWITDQSINWPYPAVSAVNFSLPA